MGVEKRIVERAGFPCMKFNQFLLLTYFGPKLLPHVETMWIDHLAVTTRPAIAGE